MLPCFALLCAGQQSECTAVNGDQIQGRDMAKVLPAFSAIPPDAPLAPAPAMNGSRVFSAAELEALERRFAIGVDGAGPVCFRLAVETPSRALVTSAMIEVLPDPGAHIEVLETGPELAPHGRYEFHRAGLSSPALPGRKTPVLWRGEVIYGENRNFPVWARVRVTVPLKRFLAVEDLRQGVPIQASQVRAETVESFPVPSGRGLTLDQIAGMVPRRRIAAGSELVAENLTRPVDVARGAMVHVEARIGSARVVLTARAESAGRVGDLIAVRNIESSRVFSARVDGKDSVLVEPAAVLEQ
jgi:flagella basal body P-ring formation protein FlgA